MVGDHAIVGMGSVVLHDVAPGSVVAGNPAAPIRRTC
jgi:acetyltransferase-like isoleucine patch superfamily enzyme